jgi:methyl-accepting chemotaxis protein
MNATQWKVGTRLALGFGLVLLMMTVLNVIGIAYLTAIGRINTRLIEKDWVRADAANTVNAMTRENARLTMQLFIAGDQAGTERILAQIDANKKHIGNALVVLERHTDAPQARALLAGIADSRKQYVTSFTRVAKLLEEQKRDEAAALMNSETVFLLQKLQDGVRQMQELQKAAVEDGGREIAQGIDAARLLMLLAGAAAAAIGVGAAVVITRGLTKQLGGEPAYAAAIAGRIAQGDLAVDIATTASDRGSLLFAMKAMRDDLEKLVRRVRSGTEAMATASAQIASGNQDLSGRTEQQAGAIEETAHSMEILASTVASNADSARQASEMVLAASEVAVRSGDVVEQVVQTMDAIDESSRRIADIIGVIDGIAFQTNILALNAAVEAARAGEQGRGFAVVAAEVRQLAQRSASAAKEIKELIGTSVERVHAGTALAGQAGDTIKDVIASVRRVASMMNEMAAASADQSAGIRQINSAIGQMAQTTQQNAALVEQAAAAAESMQEQARSLAEAAAVFKFGEVAAVLAATSAATSTAVAQATAKVVRLSGHAKASRRPVAVLAGKRREDAG